MYEKDDRRAGRRDWPLATAVLVIAALGGGGAWLWYSADRAPAPVQQAPAQDPALPEAAGLQEEQLTLTLCMPEDGMLRQVPAGIRRQPEMQLEARGAAAALLTGEQAALSPVLKDLELRALYLDGSGTAYLDLAVRDRKDLRASVRDELLAVYAFVNTLTQNFPDVRQVRFLLDGREAHTLAGHLDLSRAFLRRDDLVRP